MTWYYCLLLTQSHEISCLFGFGLLISRFKLLKLVELQNESDTKRSIPTLSRNESY